MKKNPAAVALGKLGGARRAENMTPEERSAAAAAAVAARNEKLSAKRRREIARQAAEARWHGKVKAR
jgi:hypothetical protein